MLAALAEALMEAARTARHSRGRIEGRAGGGWVLADFGSVIVHVFSPDRREFYGLEDLWHEAKVLVRVQ